eukprot:SAG31_NODE_335_length_17509_cov_7.127972_10_plen_83_part_00
MNGDTFSISALHLSIKVPYFSNSGHKNEKVTSYRVTKSEACERSDGMFDELQTGWGSGSTEIHRPSVTPSCVDPTFVNAARI